MSKALKSAIEANDPQLAQQAIRKLKDLNRKLPGTTTPLLLACRLGAGRVLPLLLDAGAAVKGEDSYVGNHPFVVAEEHGQAAIMQLLFERKLVSAPVLRHALQDAAMHGREEMLRFILKEFKPPIDAMMIRMAAHSRKPGVLRAIAEAGADFNQREDHATGTGMTPLHSSVAYGDPELIRVMVECGAEVNGRDALGRTPLMVLAASIPEMQRGKEDAQLLAEEGDPADNVPGQPISDDWEQSIRVLLELGADATLRDNDENDAVDHYRFENWRDRSPEIRAVITLLRKAGARGDEPTLRLFQAETAAAMRKAIAAGADVNRVPPPELHASPLSWAAAFETLEMLELLLEAGADVNKPDRDGTPLIHAAERGNVPAVKRLIEAGADVEALEPATPASDRPRRNAYLAAEESNRLDVVNYLKSIGSGRPKPTRWTPIEAGVHNWNDFSEVLAMGDVGPVASALAHVIGGRVQSQAYGSFVKPGKHAYVVVRPRGMAWCNILRISPPRQRFDDEKRLASFCRELAGASVASVLSIQYSDTSDAALVDRYEPNGQTSREEGWDRDTLQEMIEAAGDQAPAWAKKKLAQLERQGDELTSAQRLEKLAESEKFAAAALWIEGAPGRELELGFPGYPAEAFDGVALVST